MHWICVLKAESSVCGFGPRPWCLCPWATHFTIIASLHRGVNGYLWGQSWLISPGPICAVMAAIELYTPHGADMVSGMIYAPDEQGYNVKRCDTSCKSAIKISLLMLLRGIRGHSWIRPLHAHKYWPCPLSSLTRLMSKPSSIGAGPTKKIFWTNIMCYFQDIICCINAPEMQGHGGHQYKLLSTNYDRII